MYTTSIRKSLCSIDTSLHMNSDVHMYVHVLFYLFKYVQIKLYIIIYYVHGSVKTGLMDCYNFDETLTFDHLLL